MSSPDEPDDDSNTKVTRVDAVAGAPAATRAYLIVVAGKSSVGKMFPIKGEMTIGRTGAADIVLMDDGVSRKHAKVKLMPNGNVEIEDLNSTNGTYFQGERISSQVLRDGDKVQIGSTAVLKFSYQDQLEEALQKNLYESATRDGLTRLHNKKYFKEALDKEFSYATRHKVPMAVVMIDVDHFKKVNDTYGHPVGDVVLQKLSQVLLGQVRAEDVVSRYGGEEFALILRQSTEDTALKCAERVRSEVAKTDFRHDNQRFPVTVSVGVATSADPKVAVPDDLVAIADEYLYRAKRGGRNRVESRKATER